jgi:membrane protease YdiL (CAAX protease family)
MLPALLLPALLLAGALAAAWWFLRCRTPAATRGGRYQSWLRRAGLAFAMPVLVALALLGRLDALWRLPAEFAGVRGYFPAMPAGEVMIGALTGTAIGLVAAAWRTRRGGRPIGRPGALMPRSRAELPWGAAVAVAAGVTEEPFFRLLLPLLIAIVTGSAVAGFVLSLLLFGAMHRYQGWRGMIATAVFGGVMTGVYLVSGALWLVIALHVLIDLNGLVLWPALSSSAASRSGRSS